MSAYIISRVSINDPDAMARYMADAPETVLSHGGKYLLRTGRIEVLEGKSDYDRVVVLEFPDRQAALNWYHSDDYAALRQDRWNASDAHIIVVPDEGALSA